MLSRIHQLREISSIYIYCMNKDYHQEWIKGVIVELEDLVAKIRSAQLTRNRNKVDEPISVSVFDPDIDRDQWATEPNTQFIYSQLLIDYLLLMHPTDKDKSSVIGLYQKEYADNDPELAIVCEFQQSYQAQCALWWYTRDSFLARSIRVLL